MGKSVFLTQEAILGYIFSADNLLIAKYLHDEGIQMPSNVNFYCESSWNDTGFFETAIRAVFPDAAAIETSGGDDFDPYLIHIQGLVDVQEWRELRVAFEKDTRFLKDDTELLRLLVASCPYFFLTMEGAFTSDDGIELRLDEERSMSTYIEMVKALVTFRKTLRMKLHVWRELNESIGRIANCLAR